MMLKYGLADLRPLVCRSCVHISMHIIVLCLKLEEKQFCDLSLCIEMMSRLIVHSRLKYVHTVARLHVRDGAIFEILLRYRYNATSHL